MPTEVEIKLALAGPEEHQRLLDRLGEAREVIRQRNVFFDGPDGEIGRARVTLRLRAAINYWQRPGHFMVGQRLQHDAIDADEDEALPFLHSAQHRSGRSPRTDNQQPYRSQSKATQA